jgi:hypothetical protein
MKLDFRIIILLWAVSIFQLNILINQSLSRPKISHLLYRPSLNFHTKTSFRKIKNIINAKINYHIKNLEISSIISIIIQTATIMTTICSNTSKDISICNHWTQIGNSRINTVNPQNLVSILNNNNVLNVFVAWGE